MSENEKQVEENNLAAHEEDQALRQITFDYTQSNLFRVVHVDGATASITPNLDIDLVFWSEHHSIPVEVTYEVSPEGTLGREIGRVNRDTIVREVEVSMPISISTARALIELLETAVKQIEQIQDEQGQGE